MGQACVTDKQTSQRSFSVDSTVEKFQLSHNQKRSLQASPVGNDFEPVFVEEGVEFNHAFYRRNEKMRTYGQNSMPKSRDD